MNKNHIIKELKHNNMELWEVLDKNGNNTGEIMKKNDETFFKKGFCHLGAEVWIINSENKFLIQKRASNKKIFPNMWAMMGGSVIVGENSKQTIVREAKEELNINIDINKLEFITKFRVDSLIVETYLLKNDFEIKNMKLKKDEVSEVKWMTLQEIEKLVEKEQFFKNRWKYVKKYLENLYF